MARRSEGPLVSVIVPTYNRLGTLVESLRSIQDQTYPYIEIIVINDGGVEIEDVLPRSDRGKKITYIKHSGNKGLPAARNSGIQAARGKYIAYLDDDDRYYPEHVEILVNHMASNDCRVAYTDACRVHQEQLGGKYIIRKRDVPHSVDFDPDRILLCNYIPVLCMMHERACLDQAGCFDEKLTSFEDWDLWIRMSRFYQFCHIRKVTCEYSWRHDATSMTSQRRVDYVRNLKLIHDRYKSLASDSPGLLLAQRKIIKKQELLVEGWITIDRLSRMLGNRFMFLQALKRYLV